MGAQPHYVRNYERMVTRLLAHYPLEEAMSRAVGGDYDRGGVVQADILVGLGLRAGHEIVDFGCGSGRLSTELGRRFGGAIGYLGVDVVQPLLDYAASKAPASYRFLRHLELSLPAPDASADFLAAFSVFTHPHRSETMAYLTEANRVLRPGGTAACSLLTLRLYVRGLPSTLLGRQPHLNSYIRPATIASWARRCGFVLEQMLAPGLLGQHVAVLRKPR
jgi:SAM-dependent methyltransferase